MPMTAQMTAAGRIQPNGITIEEVLNKKLSKLTGEEIRVIGASRTDSGVHARGNVAVFDTDTTIPPDRLAYALNRRMPEDIVIVKSEEVPADWASEGYCDTVKTYEYHILNTRVPDPYQKTDDIFCVLQPGFGKYAQGGGVSAWRTRTSEVSATSGPT